MKRLWIGIAALVVVLGACLWTTFAMNSIHDPISAKLERASEAALAGDWQAAKALARDAQSRWERSRRVTASAADHTPMDEVDGLFAQLPVYARGEEPVDFAAACAQLSKLVTAVGDAHSFNWWNLL